MTRELLQQALDALETCTPGDYSTGHVIHPWHDDALIDAAADAIRDHLAAQPAPEVDLRAAVNALLHQIDIGDFVDSLGHSAKMLKPVHDLMRLMASQPAPVPRPDEFVCPYCFDQPAPVPEGDIVVSYDEQGQIVCVTRQDADGRFLSVIAESANLPAGWKLVPVEPTPEMIAAGERSGAYGGYSEADCYSRMIAAAPGATK